MSGEKNSISNSSAEAEILLEAAKAIEDVNSILQKSVKPPLKKKEEPKEKKIPSEKSEGKDAEDVNPSDNEEVSSDSEVESPKEDLEKDGDAVVGETPESSEKSEEGEVATPGLDFASMSEEQLLDIASKALEAVSSRAIPDRSADDVESAEHEIGELKEDMAPAADPAAELPSEVAPSAIAEDITQAESAVQPVTSPEMVKQDVSSAMPVAQDPSMIEPDLNSILGQRDIDSLTKFHQKLGEHLAARAEMQKASAAPITPRAEKPAPAVAPAMAMMKSLEESMKKSFKESLEAMKAEFKPILEDNKKLSSELASMKKSFNQFKKDLDSIPVKIYASGNNNAKADEKTLAKSVMDAPVEVPLMSGYELADKILTLQKSNRGSKVEFHKLVSKASLAKSYSEVERVKNELESLGFKI